MIHNRYVFVAIIAASIPSLAYSQQIEVIEGSYGANIGGKGIGYATEILTIACDGKMVCHFLIDHEKIGDPYVNGAKAFNAKWSCGGVDVKRADVPEEASGATITLACP